MEEIRKLEVLAVIEAMCKLDKEQAVLFERLMKAHKDPKQLEKLYRET
jgi:hypothetical protein